MHQRYKTQGLEILAFPCNQFGRQAPGTSRELRAFADKIGATFRIMAEVNVNEPEEHRVFTALKQGGSPIPKDFHTQFLVACGKQRCTVHRFDGVTPRTLLPDIKDLLETTLVD
jgi:glutathione peroxidase